MSTLSKKTKTLLEAEVLENFKKHILNMRESKNFDSEKITRKLRKFCKTRTLGNIVYIKLKHSKKSITFSINQTPNIHKNEHVLNVTHISNKPQIENFLIFASSQKEFLYKLFIKHKLFDTVEHLDEVVYEQ